MEAALSSSAADTVTVRASLQFDMRGQTGARRPSGWLPAVPSRQGDPGSSQLPGKATASVTAAAGVPGSLEYTRTWFVTVSVTRIE